MEYVYAREIGEGDEYTDRDGDWVVLRRHVELNGQIELRVYLLGPVRKEVIRYFDPTQEVARLRTSGQAKEERAQHHHRIGNAHIQNDYERRMGW